MPGNTLPGNTLKSLLLALLPAIALAFVALPAAHAATRTYQAESAALSGGAAFSTEHAGYTGSGFVAGYTDGNKGRAATTFTVTAATAGPATVGLRYANGTTATMSLSVYVNGTKIRQISLPAVGAWNTWATRDETFTLNAGQNTIAYRFDATDLGNVNLDSITVADPVAALPYEMETAFLSGGASVATAIGGYAGTGYATGFTTPGARAI
ncbi:carbohydrate-binding protein, partial [Nonomuraea fuscirosea]